MSRNTRQASDNGPPRIDTTEKREEIHKKSFTNWLNAKLRKAVPPVQVKDLFTDLQDGTVLLSLLETLLGGTKLEREKGNLLIHKVGNMTRAFELLEKHKVKLVGISATEIVYGAPLATLGLMWHIILRFQMQDIMQESSQGFGIEKKLSSWCDKRLNSYRDYVKVKDLSSSWRDGLAFNALIHSYRPAFSMERIKACDNETRLEHAFDIAGREFGVPKLIESKDVNVDKPDKKLITLYLTCLYQHLEETRREEVKSGVKAVFEESIQVESAGASPMEIEPIVDSRKVVSTISRISTELPVMQQQSRSETVTYTTKVLSASSSQRSSSSRSSSVISTSSSRSSSSSSSISSTEPSSPTETMTHTVRKQFYLRKRTGEKHTSRRVITRTEEGPEFMITEVKKAKVASVESPEEIRKRISDVSSASSEETVVEVCTGSHDVEAAMEDSWDNIDAGPTTRSVNYVALKSKFSDVELLLSGLETKLAGMSGEATNRDYSFKVCLEEIESVRIQVYILINETGTLIDNKDISPEEAGEMKDDIERVEKRLQLITERCDKDFKRSSMRYLTSLKQRLTEANEQISALEDNLTQKDFEQLLSKLSPAQTKVAGAIEETRSVIQSSVLTEPHEYEIKEMLGATGGRLKKFLEDYQREHSRSSSEHLRTLKMKLADIETIISDLHSKLKRPETFKNIEVDLGVLQLKVTEVVQEGRDMVGEKYFVDSDEHVVQEKLADVERKMQELVQSQNKERLRLSAAHMKTLNVNLDGVTTMVSNVKSKLSRGASLKDTEEELIAVKAKATKVFQEGRDMIDKRYFTEADERTAQTRIKDVENELEGLGQSVSKERSRYSSELLEKMKKELSDVDASLSDLEKKLPFRDRAQLQEILENISSLDADVSAVLKKQREIIDNERLPSPHSEYIKERIDKTDKQLRSLLERCNKECERLSSENLETFMTQMDDLDSMLSDVELKTVKGEPEHEKDTDLELEAVSAKAEFVLEEGRDMIDDKCFVQPDENKVQERIISTEKRLDEITENRKKERERRSTELMELLKKALSDVDGSLTALEKKSTSTNKDARKEFMEALEPVESKTNAVLDEGRNVISTKRLDPIHAKFIGERINKTENRLGFLLEIFNKERQRSAAEQDFAFNKKLDDVQKSILDLDKKIHDPVAQKDFEVILSSVLLNADDILDEGQDLIDRKCFTKPEEDKIQGRIDDIVQQLEELSAKRKSWQEKSSAELMEKLKKKLDDIDSMITEMEGNAQSSDRNMQKEFRDGMSPLEMQIQYVMNEGKQAIDSKLLTNSDASYIDERVDDTEERLENLLELHRKERRRYSSSLMINLEKKLSSVEALMTNLESKMDDPNSEKFVFQDLEKELRVVQHEADDVLDEAQDLMDTKRFIKSDEDKLQDRTEDIERRLENLETKMRAKRDRSVAAMLELLDALKKKLNEVEKSLSELEGKSKSPVKAKRKEFINEFERVEDRTNTVLNEGKDAIARKQLAQPMIEYLEDRLGNIEVRLKLLTKLKQKRISEEKLDYLLEKLTGVEAEMTSLEPLLHITTVPEKSFMEKLHFVTENVNGALDEGRLMVDKGCFLPYDENVAVERMAQTEKRLREVRDIFQRKQERSGVDHLKNALDDVDASLFSVEQKLCNVQKEYSDPSQAGGKDLQLYKDFKEDVGHVEVKGDEALEEVRQSLTEGSFDPSDKSYIGERLEQTHGNLKDIVGKADDERNRISNYYLEYLKSKLNEIDTPIFALEFKLGHVNNQTFNYVDFMADVNEIQSKASKIYKEGRTMVMKLYFTQPDAAYVTDRMDDTEQRLRNLQTKAQKQLSRSSGGHVDFLKMKLDQVEKELNEVEKRSKVEEKDYIDLRIAKQQLDTYKEFVEDLAIVETKSFEVLDEASHMIFNKLFAKSDEVYFQERIDELTKRLKELVVFSEEEKQSLFDVYHLLLLQHIARLDDWLTRAEKHISLSDDIGPNYETVGKQVESHKNFEADLGDHSVVHVILQLDITDPDIEDDIREQVGSLSERWAAVWNWFGDRKKILSQVLSDWEKFRDASRSLLNWLTAKEKELELMNITDLTDENELQEHYELLDAADEQMRQQDNKLLALHQLADELIADAEYDDIVAEKILDQLRDFDDCWNETAERISNRKDQLHNFENNLKQFGDIIGEVKRWMNDTEKLLKTYSATRECEDEGLDNDNAKMEEKIEIKCEERDDFRKKLDKANRLSKDMSGSLDLSSCQALQEVLKPVNTRYKTVSDALDNCRDQSLVNSNECCFVRFIKRGLVLSK